MSERNEFFGAAIALLWLGVVCGAGYLGLFALVIHQRFGQQPDSLFISAAVLIFVQIRIILALHNGKPAARTRLAILVALRTALLLVNIKAIAVISPGVALIALLGIAAQLAALGVLYLTPARFRFA